jgi:hypothetical protein
MADVKKQLNTLQSLYADNNTGDISPQDIRDGFKSVVGTYYLSATAGTSNVYLSANDVFVNLNTSAGARYAFLPSPSATDGSGDTFNGKFFIISNEEPEYAIPPFYAVTLSATDSSLINESTSYTLPSNKSVIVGSIGTKWVVLGTSNYVLTNRNDALYIRSNNTNYPAFKCSDGTTSGFYNVLAGYRAGEATYISPSSAVSRNAVLGHEAAINLQGSDNVILGAYASNVMSMQNKSVVIGPYAGSGVTVASACTFIGYSTAVNETSSYDKLIIDNRERNIDSCSANSLIYATMGNAPAAQVFTINAGNVAINGGATYPTLRFFNTSTGLSSTDGSYIGLDHDNH